MKKMPSWNLRIGTSAGGARPKAVIAYNENWRSKSGQTNVPKGLRALAHEARQEGDAKWGEKQKDMAESKWRIIPWQ